MRKLLVLFSLVMVILFATGCLDGTGHLLNTGTIRGYVTDTAGQPISEKHVIVSGNWSYTDVNGYYEVNDLPPANHTVLFQEFGYETYEQIVSVAAGSDNQIDIVVTPTPKVTLSGFMKDITNTLFNPGYIRYELVSDNFYESGYFYANYDGSYAVELFPGTYRFDFSYYDANYNYISTSFVVDVMSSMSKDFYFWTGEFTNDLTMNPIITWPSVNIGRDVYYEVDVVKVPGYYSEEGNVVVQAYRGLTASTLQLETLLNKGAYALQYRVYDATTYELITWTKSNTFYPETLVPTPIEQVEGFINDFESYGNGNYWYGIENLISDSYSDSYGRTKYSFIDYLHQEWWYFVLHDFNITVQTDIDGNLVSASATLIKSEYDYYSESLNETLVSIEVVMENGTLKLVSVQ